MWQTMNSQHQRDAQPDRAAGQNMRRARDQRRNVRDVQVAGVLHSLAQNRIPHRAEQDQEKQQDVGFCFVSLRGGHFRKSVAQASACG